MWLNNTVTNKVTTCREQGKAYRGRARVREDVAVALLEGGVRKAPVALRAACVMVLQKRCGATWPVAHHAGRLGLGVRKPPQFVPLKSVMEDALQVL